MKLETLTRFNSNYYWYLFIIYTLSLFTTSVKAGALAALLMIIISINLIMINIKRGIKLDWIIFGYIYYNIFSVFWFPFDKLPINVYIIELAYSIFPIVFYFIKNVEGRTTLFLDKSMNAIFYTLILGLILYITAPTFYGEYLVNHHYSSNSAAGWIRATLQSVYGVTAVGTFSAIALLYAYMKIMKESKLKYLLMFVIVFICLVLSFRRSAWLAFIAVFVIFHYLVYIKSKKIKVIPVLIEIVLVTSILFVLGSVFSSQLDMIVTRFSSLIGAVGERSGNWNSGIESTSNFLIGNGLGSMNHASREYGNVGVYDSSYIKMYAETGIIGLSLFFLVIARALFSGLMKVDRYYIEFGVIIVFLIQSIGSNVLAFQVLAPIFWYSIGQCSRKEIHKTIYVNNMS